jgi:hypothetical protein
MRLSFCQELTVICHFCYSAIRNNETLAKITGFLDIRMGCTTTTTTTTTITAVAAAAAAVAKRRTKNSSRLEKKALLSLCSFVLFLLYKNH